MVRLTYPDGQSVTARLDRILAASDDGVRLKARAGPLEAVADGALRAEVMPRLDSEPALMRFPSEGEAAGGIAWLNIGMMAFATDSYVDHATYGRLPVTTVFQSAGGIDDGFSFVTVTEPGASVREYIHGLAGMVVEVDG